MKNLIYIFFFVSFPALACQLSIPERDIARFLAPPVSGHYLKCEDYPDDKCICVENIDPWATDLIDDELVYNSDKAFARENSEKAAKDAEKAKEDKCKNFSFKGNTIAQLRQELNESLGCRK
jgi:hypothetical protein